jgi:peroxiredoxin
MAIGVLAMVGMGSGVVRGEGEEVAVNVKEMGTNKPLSGVKVTIRGTTARGDFFTGDDGAAKIPVPADEQYVSLRGSSEGLVPVSLYWRGGSGKRPDHFDLVMEHAAAISGMVADQAGQPLAGAKVMCVVSKKYPNGEQLAGNWTAVTADAQGHWSFESVPETFDSIQLGAYHRNCLQANPYYEMVAFPDVAGLKNGTAVLKLQRGTPVTITVKNAEGRPIRNASVTYGTERNGSNAYPAEKTDGQGMLTLGIVPNVEAVLTVQLKSYAPELARVHVGGDAQTVNITLEKGHLLEGNVLEANGDPATNARVYVESWRGARTLNKNIKVDADGHFSWTDAPADEVVVQVGTSSGNKEGIKMKAGDENRVTMAAPTTFKGTVVDKETGQPVTAYKVMAGLAWDQTQAMNWVEADNSGSQVEPDGGTFLVTMSQSYPWREFRVTADGCYPSDSTRFQMEGKEVAFTFKLEKGKPLTGTLAGADGKKIAGATVMLVLAGSNVQVNNGALDEWAVRGMTSATTGADGAFTLPPQREDYLLLVVADAGFAQVSKAAFDKDNQVTLKAWSNLDGVARRGTKPDAGVIVQGWTSDPWVQNKPRVGWSYSATTDAEGKFHLDRLAAGSIGFGRRLDLGNNSSTVTSTTTVKIEPGAAARLQIGGVGRPVVGHVVVPAEVAGAGYAVSNARIWSTGINSGQLGSQFVVRPDGSFQSDDIAPGTYTVDATVTDLSKPNEWMRGVQIGTVHGTFTMPPVAGGVSDEPLDIGSLTMSIVATAGSKAPELSVKTVDATDWSLSGQKGKIVVVEFWSAVYSPTTADQPKLAAVWAAHGKDPHFAMIGLSMGDATGEVTKKLMAAHDMHWPVAAVGMDRQQAMLQEYPMQGFPTIWVIGTDGMVMGQNIQASQLEAFVTERLKTVK